MTYTTTYRELTNLISGGTLEDRLEFVAYWFTATEADPGISKALENPDAEVEVEELTDDEHLQMREEWKRLQDED